MASILFILSYTIYGNDLTGIIIVVVMLCLSN